MGPGSYPPPPPSPSPPPRYLYPILNPRPALFVGELSSPVLAPQGTHRYPPIPSCLNMNSLLIKKKKKNHSIWLSHMDQEKILFEMNNVTIKDTCGSNYK